MLPFNEKQISWYKQMRFFHLLASATCVVLGLYYYKLQGLDFMGAFSYVGTLYCLAFLMFFRQYTYPSDFRGAISITLGLVVNFFIAYFITDEGWLYSCYYIFFFYLCLQALSVVGFAIVTMMAKKPTVEIWNVKKMKRKDYWLMGLVILVFGLPLIASPYLLREPFLEVMEKVDSDEKIWIWIGFFGDLLQQGFIIWKIVFAKPYEHEVNQKQAALLKDWEGAINMMFFLALISMVVIMFI